MLVQFTLGSRYRICRGWRFKFRIKYLWYVVKRFFNLKRKRERYPGYIEELRERLERAEWEVSERGYRACADELKAYKWGIKRGRKQVEDERAE